MTTTTDTPIQPTTSTTMTFTLSDPDARHALIGCYLYLNADTGDVEGAVAVTIQSRGLLVLTTRPAVVLCSYLETLEEGAAALVLGLSGEAAYSLQAAELALSVIDTTEEMGIPVSIGQAAEPWGVYIGTNLTILALVNRACEENDDCSVGTDWRDSDFGKIIWKDVRIDIWTGFGPVVRLILAGAEEVTNRTGITEPRSRPRRPTSLVDEFLRYKLSPAFSLVNELVTQRDAVGNERTIYETLVRAPAPISLEGAYDAYVAHGWFGGVLGGSLDGAGISTNVYNSLLKSAGTQEYFASANMAPPRGPSPGDGDYPEEASIVERREMQYLYETKLAELLEQNGVELDGLSTTAPEDEDYSPRESRIRELAREARVDAILELYSDATREPAFQFQTR